MAGKIKVLLGNTPRMLRESLKDLVERQNDMELVGEQIDPVNIFLAVKKYRADVVFLTLRDADADPGLCSHLLFEFPQLLIIAMSEEQEPAFLYRLMILKEQLSQVSHDEILNIIREWAGGARFLTVLPKESS